ncbi:hypothetical protein H4W30_001415 [Amycolatopsis roodepoortensis]|uniref:Uncharacterized protein n=1 Tax=Amycolatopsis roodepoortensis TaxID=700274 RepID=A0ABR9L197_9PSEU|nr:hypothetical protein [Amycolatopsis roodepoortensis]
MLPEVAKLGNFWWLDGKCSDGMAELDVAGQAQTVC